MSAPKKEASAPLELVESRGQGARPVFDPGRTREYFVQRAYWCPRLMAA
jgi:hypothetical protein